MDDVQDTMSQPTRSPSPTTLRMLRLSRLSSGESEEMRDGAGGVGGGSGSMKSVERGVSGVSELNLEEKEGKGRKDVFVFKAKANSNVTQSSSMGGGINLGLGVGGMAGVGGVAGVGKASLPKLIPPKLPNVSTDLKFDAKSSSYLMTTFKTGLPVLIPPDLPSVSGSALALDDVSRRYLNGVNGEEVEDLKQRVKDLETQVQLLLQHGVGTGAIRGVDEQALVDEMVVDNAANNEQNGGENAPAAAAAAAEQQPAWMNFPLLPLLKYLGLCTLLTLRESSKPIPLYLKVLKSVTFLVMAIATWYAQNFSRAEEAGEERWALLRVGRDGGRLWDVVWFFGSLCFSLWPGWEIGDGGPIEREEGGEGESEGEGVVSEGDGEGEGVGGEGEGEEGDGEGDEEPPVVEEHPHQD